jgi:putative addiction module component (TIGR02574 family)
MTDLLTQALALPEGERAALAHQLLASLEPAVEDEGVEDAWAVELDARLARVDNGSAELQDWDEAAADIEKKVAERRKR